MKKIITMILVLMIGVFLTGCTSTASSEEVTVKQTGANSAKVTVEGQDAETEVNVRMKGIGVR